MRRLTDLSRYPALAVFLFMSACAAVTAWISFGLLSLAMENARYLEHFGLMAAIDGGLLQAALIGLKGLAAIFLYLVFKACEDELLDRWRALQQKPTPTPPKD
ncbi:MAG: hypothetical protein ACKVPY_16810 [Paracoccaceae bacterium]